MRRADRTAIDRQRDEQHEKPKDTVFAPELVQRAGSGYEVVQQAAP